MSRPEWARRDRRPLIAALAAGVAGVCVLALFVACIVLATQGLL